VHADRGVQIGVGRGHDRGHRATGGESGDVDAARVDDEVAHDWRVMPAMMAGSPAPGRWSVGENQFQ
jgi:hypothetical protein